MTSFTTTKDRIVVSHGDWRAVYHGGAYIDVHHASKPDYALDCINVWDYEAGEATIPFERRAVRAELLAWARESGDDFVRETSLPAR